MPRALLVIDVQESFRARDSWTTFADPDIADRVGPLVERFRASGDAVFWILHAEPGSGGVFDPERGQVRLMEPLQPAPGEPVLVKTSINAFTTTNLHQSLVRARVDEVVVCGIRTEQCCETTARVASDLGYRVSFLIDATTTSPTPRLSAEQIIERTAEVLQERGFARVLTVDELFGLVPTA